MKIGFLVSVDCSMAKKIPTVQIECDSENPPLFVVQIAAKHLSALAADLEKQAKELKVV